MEILNKYFVSRCIIVINRKFENFTILFDTGVIGEIFINKSYAQPHNIYFISLIKIFFLQNFGKKFTGSKPVTHFVTDFYVKDGFRLD